MSGCLTLSPVGPILPVTPGSPCRDKNVSFHFFALIKVFLKEKCNVQEFSVSTLSPSGPTFPGNPFLPIRP